MTQKVKRRDRRRRQRELLATKPQPLWVTVGIDVVNLGLILMGQARTQEEALTHHDRCPEAGYVRSFEFFSTNGEVYYKWFRDCGISTDDATQLVRGFGQLMQEINDAIAVEQGWIPPTQKGRHG